MYIFRYTRFSVTNQSALADDDLSQVYPIQRNQPECDDYFRSVSFIVQRKVRLKKFSLQKKERKKESTLLGSNIQNLKRDYTHDCASNV